MEEAEKAKKDKNELRKGKKLLKRGKCRGESRPQADHGGQIRGDL